MLHDVKQTQVSIILAGAIAFVAIDNNASYLESGNAKWKIANKIACLKGTNFQTGFLKNISQKQSLQLVTDRGLTLPNLLGRYELSNKYLTLSLEKLNLYAF